MPHFPSSRLVLALLAVVACATGGEPADSGHPYLLWTKAELAALRAQVANDPAARKRFEALAASDARTGKNNNNAMVNLMRYAVLGDAKAGAAEKGALLKFIGTKIPDNRQGDPNIRNAAWREDRTHDAMRYDVLYDELTAEQRSAIEATAKGIIDWCIANPGPWSLNGPGDPGTKAANPSAKSRARTGWLPNMQWPTMIGAHVWAVAMRDRDAIERIANCDGGWKWYLDHYIVDKRFYMEEFAKYYSNIGGMIWWCQGCERLGLDQLGWGYTGAGGATMRGFLGNLPDAALPEVRTAEGWSIPVTWMGDAGRPVVAASGPLTPSWRWGGGMMNGMAAKALTQLWWEAAHRKFPDDGFGWFLSRMIPPEDTAYLPTPWFPQPPIPATVKPRAAPSYVAWERGFAMLRAEESAAYWDSPKPAATFQFGMYYVHYVSDCFSILDYVANNRQLYAKIGAVGGGYAGGDPWRDHCRGQGSAVVIDDLRAAFVDSGENGCKNQRIRSDFNGIRFTAARASGIYPQVDLERALLLTDDYLVDATWIASGTPRLCDWHVIAHAVPLSLDGWQPAEALPGDAQRDQLHQAVIAARTKADEARIASAGSVTAANIKPMPERNRTGYLSELRSRGETSDNWSMDFLCPPLSATAAKAGVRVHQLGAPGTSLSIGLPPGVAAGSAVTKLIATRQAANTCFAAVHEPFPDGPKSARIAKIAAFSQPATGSIVALAITGQPGSGIDDRVVIHGFDSAERPVTLVDGPLTLTTTGHGWVRLAADRITVWGAVQALELRGAAAAIKLVVGGVEVPATRTGDVLRWKR
ncbi:hypothetical protein LBMAG53_29830 [Planctomycetota bacterium]|nr:hypothetical protein LBMAG53_29830 [Planctomycetota bacterium]